MIPMQRDTIFRIASITKPITAEFTPELREQEERLRAQVEQTAKGAKR